MKKKLLAICVLFCAVFAIYGQGAGVVTQNNDAQNTIRRLDSAVKSLAADIDSRLSAAGARKAAVGQFIYHDSIPVLGSYWNAQLIQELAALPNRSWTLLAGPAPDAEWVINGEIVDIINSVRVYTRITRTENRSIVTGLQSDFNMDEFVQEMLVSGGTGNGGRVVPRDAYESDSMANPLAVELAGGDGGPVINRTLHSSSDEDFFLVTPDADGMLIFETTGDVDTRMELYEADSGRKTAENDDGGSGGNARIRRSVTAGGRYIAKVRGYSGETGAYGFRAYMTEDIRFSPDEYEEDNSFDTAREMHAGTPQRHTFHVGDDIDYVKFQITRSGRYTIRARGINDNRIDTCIELFSAARDSIEEDDDGGEELDSRISRHLDEGTYYLMVKCLDDEPEEPYTISIEAE